MLHAVTNKQLRVENSGVALTFYMYQWVTGQSLDQVTRRPGQDSS